MAQGRIGYIVVYSLPQLYLTPLFRRKQIRNNVLHSASFRGVVGIRRPEIAANPSRNRDKVKKSYKVSPCHDRHFYCQPPPEYSLTLPMKKTEEHWYLMW
jgi:hypothetical protein